MHQMVPIFPDRASPKRALSKIPKLRFCPPSPNHTLCSSLAVSPTSLALVGLQVDRASATSLLVLRLLPLHAFPTGFDFILFLLHTFPATFDFVLFPLHTFPTAMTLSCFFVHFLPLWICLVSSCISCYCD